MFWFLIPISLLLSRINGSLGKSIDSRDATITIDCGGTATQITTPETTIQSPNYPNNYPNLRDCSAVVQFAPGQRVSVEFLAFNVEAHSSCVYDWLEIRDGSDSTADLLSTRLCGEQLFAPITSTGNSLHIHFHSDGSVKRSGFQLKVKIADPNAPTTTTQSPPSGTCIGSSFNFDNYFRWNNHKDFLSCLSTTYPDRAQIINIGSSIEGREIRVIKIGRPRADGTVKPAVWIDGGIHAREWISPAAVEYVVHKLVENVGTEVSNLVDTFDIYVVPVLNPDGYEYSHTNYRLWRKNRRINSGNSCKGVDLNRNWGYQWGGAGASTNPCSDTYRGTGPFSEPETAAVRDFINAQKQNQDFQLFLTYHSYGQFILHTWGYRRGTPPNVAELTEMGNIAAQAIQNVNGNRYRVGGAADLLYEASGGSDDWAQGGAGIRYSFTMELPPTWGVGSPGFELPPDQILPVGRETYAGVTAMLRKLIEVSGISTTAAPEVTTTTTLPTSADPITTTTVAPVVTTTFSPPSNTSCNGNPRTDWSCCDYNEPCTEGGGDCDHDSDCLGILKCGNNNCLADYSGPGSNWSPSADCCYDPSRDCRGSPSTDWNCCSDAFPCMEGQGDCDEDSQCEGDLTCGADNCMTDFSTAASNWVTGADCCTSGNIPATSPTTPLITTTTETSTIPITTTQSGTAPTVTIDCSSPFDEVLTPGTVIISPNYPNSYDDGLNCQMTIRFSDSPTVLIEFDPNYEIESGSGCSYDYLEARDGPSADSPRIGEKLCGRNVPAPIQSTGNSMYLKFRTDGSVTKTGFKITANTAGPATTTTPRPSLPPPSSANCGVKPPSRIIGGGEAGAYSLPWQVALVRPGRSQPFCGGTLISDRHVLTAAHCTGSSSGNGGAWDVIVGEHDVTDSSDGTRHTVCRWVNHPDYNRPSAINNDFAIVTLTQAVTIGTRANYACLPTSTMGGSFLDDKTVTVSGWGDLVGGGTGPTRLYEVDLPGMSNSACSQLSELSLPITDQMLCAGRFGENAVGACHGDSGGPLTYTEGGITTVVGAVSWGNPSCLGTTVFARVTEVLPWIEEQMRQSGECPA